LNIQGGAVKYIELSKQLYGRIVDSFAFAKWSGLGYWRRILELASRPYAPTAIAWTTGENFDRAELARLTVASSARTFKWRLISPGCFLPRLETAACSA
jgi:hypothetical protein